MKLTILIRMLILLTCAFLSLSVYSDQVIYQWISKDGEMHFSDQPREGAKRRVIKEVETLASAPVKLPSNNQLTNSETATYTNFSIKAPQNKSTIRNGTGTILIELRVEPQLSENNLIQYYLDGNKTGTPQNKNTFELSNINRGSHTLSATIINESQAAIKSTEKITIYMHRPFASTKTNKQEIKIINKTSMFPKTQLIK